MGRVAPRASCEQCSCQVYRAVDASKRLCRPGQRWRKMLPYRPCCSSGSESAGCSPLTLRSENSQNTQTTVQILTYEKSAGDQPLSCEAKAVLRVPWNPGSSGRCARLWFLLQPVSGTQRRRKWPVRRPPIAALRTGARSSEAGTTSVSRFSPSSVLVSRMMSPAHTLTKEKLCRFPCREGVLV